MTQPSLLVPPVDTADVFVVLVTGSRFHADAELIGTSLYDLIEASSARTIIVRHGACPSRRRGLGADQIVAEFCEDEAEWFERDGRALIVDPVPADWDLCGSGCTDEPHRRIKKPGDIFHPGKLADYCPGAGPRRNTAMTVRLPVPDVCVAFPLGRSYGTWSCMKAARAAGIPVRPFPARGEAA